MTMTGEGDDICAHVVLGHRNDGRPDKVVRQVACTNLLDRREK
jgi:hypothetical protein